MRDFSQKGFDMIEGSEWTTFLMTKEFEDEGEYMTEAQIEKEECGIDWLHGWLAWLSWLAAWLTLG